MIESSRPGASPTQAPLVSGSDLLRNPRRWQREHWLLASCLGTVAVLVASIVPGFADAHRENAALGVAALSDEWIEERLLLPPPLETVRAEPMGDQHQWRPVTVQSGQNMADIFRAQGLSGQMLHRLLGVEGVREALTRIRPGQVFDFELDADGALTALRFEKDDSTRVVLIIDDAEVRIESEQRAIQHRVMVASGRISDSLFGAAEAAGMSNAATLELAKAFGYDIDFAQDLRVGDEFHVLYEEIWREGERLRSGDILAATFVNQGKRYQVFRYMFADGRSEYFDAEGRPMKKGFLRMPIDFARISSRFSSARRHPVLGTTRAHRGVDYAARSGTPIMAAGDGKVLFAGWKNGYGRTVILQHGNQVSTLYAHMSRFAGLRTGARVRQGDTIGYVGASGLASGPHLHYEFRVAGVHRDPLKVTMPKPEPLPAGEMARFRLQKEPLIAQLALRESNALLALRQ
ncbi:M23 family metallopeptidase [Limnoraphis robusta]|uniref:M23 family metallopeptidase n=1 Tax=Limnoraphis robusta TaxID=1118279 RepID=UPI002B204C64|nr:M23 family metallopeptidase [Limnoraphis robusta]MEA5498204.1 M23 family metallopeptidase [Limnoraphis robusta BA-68 BA1]